MLNLFKRKLRISSIIKDIPIKHPINCKPYERDEDFIFGKITVRAYVIPNIIMKAINAVFETINEKHDYLSPPIVGLDTNRGYVVSTTNKQTGETYFFYQDSENWESIIYNEPILFKKINGKFQRN
jgi:hypothetical protein